MNILWRPLHNHDRGSPKSSTLLPCRRCSVFAPTQPAKKHAFCPRGFLTNDELDCASNPDTHLCLPRMRTASLAQVQRVLWRACPPALLPPLHPLARCRRRARHRGCKTPQVSRPARPSAPSRRGTRCCCGAAVWGRSSRTWRMTCGPWPPPSHHPPSSPRTHVCTQHSLRSVFFHTPCQGLRMHLGRSSTCSLGDDSGTVGARMRDQHCGGLSAHPVHTDPD